MRQEIPETFGPEAFGLYAREVLKLELTAEELEALREGVNALIAELEPLEAMELGDDDLAVTFGLEAEGWPR